MATGGPRELVGSEHSPQLYVKVPVSTIRNPGITRFIVSITLSDGRVIERKTGTVDMQTQLKDLSTASMNTAEGQAQHDMENKILNALQFPLNGTVSDNFQTSGYHHGDALYALDISGGTGTELIAPAEGTLIKVDLFAGELVLEHKLSSGEKWYTTFYHLDNILENVSGLQYTGLLDSLAELDIEEIYKTTVANAINAFKHLSLLPNLGLPKDVLTKVQTVIDAIATVQKDLTTQIATWNTEGKKFTSANGVLATMGNEGDSKGKHLHMQVNIGSQEGRPVDQFKWLDKKFPGIRTTVGIENRDTDMQTTWNNDANALVHPGERIAMQRANRLNTAGKEEGYTRTFAWEDGKTVENMNEVIWVEDTQLKIKGWFKVDSARKIMITILDGKQYYSQWVVANGAGSWSLIIIQ